MRSEQENIAQFMPNGVQLKVMNPEIILKNGKILFKSQTPGVSFAYQINGKAYSSSEKWFLYSKPFARVKGTKISVKAVRVGYLDSEIVNAENLQ